MLSLTDANPTVPLCYHTVHLKCRHTGFRHASLSEVMGLARGRPRGIGSAFGAACRAWSECFLEAGSQRKCLCAKVTVGSRVTWQQLKRQVVVVLTAMHTQSMQELLKSVAAQSARADLELTLNLRGLGLEPRCLRLLTPARRVRCTSWTGGQRGRRCGFSS